MVAHDLLVRQPTEHGRHDFQARGLSVMRSPRTNLASMPCFLEPFGDHAAAAVNYHQRFTLFLEERQCLPESGRASRRCAAYLMTIGFSITLLLYHRENEILIFPSFVRRV